MLRARLGVAILLTAGAWTAAIACGAEVGAPGGPFADAREETGEVTEPSRDAEADGEVEEHSVDVTPKDGGAGFVGAYASPSIVRDGSTYHAYFAAQRIGGKRYNIPHATFTPAGDFTFLGEALPSLGAGAVDGTGTQPVWAPAVAQIDATHWMLYYTGEVAGQGQKKCIWRAHSATADGPFVDDYSQSIICPEGTLWAIDPYLVKDAFGNWHLAARIDEAGGINTIQMRDLGPFGAFLVPGSPWVRVTENAPSSWEQPVLENAGVVRLAPPAGAAHWFVFYSAGAWMDNRYSVGYADCGTSIDGPCVKRTTNGPWLGTDASLAVFGPGTPTFYTSETGEMLMSVQAWEHSGGKANKANNGQIMRTYKIEVDAAYVPKATLLRVDK